ncbi:YceI family protein [Maribacter halichondriae]|uniref:YceI family protein n=1 Tax=Maribacter halichondriae TaxID=2980554 RepID=UPI002359215C|nr:YceI family protein [Maribacter sp. Hal144]
MKWVCTMLLLIGLSSTMAQETYALTVDSKLTIDGTSTIHDWTVTANSMQGVVKTEGTSPIEIDFQVDVADIISERGATMDNKMHNALKKEEHPKVLFVLKEIKGQDTVSGTLTIAGNSKDVDIESKISSSGDILKISGEKKIVLKDFDIEPPTAMFGQIIVGDDVTVKFNLVFKSDQ